jgi:hypothetical protein
MNTTILIALAAGGAIAAACGGHDEKLQAVCFDVSAPGTAVFLPSIDLVITDQRGHGEALGSTVTVVAGPELVRFGGSDTLHALLGNATGTFAVRVDKQFYRDTTIAGIAVVPGDCGTIVTAKVPVTLELLPGAPAFRSVNIFGANFLGTPDDKDTLRAYFDADPEVSRGVTWRISDSTIASLTPDGIVTDKCTLDGGTETVTLVPAADTTLQATARFSIAGRTFCP